MEELAPLSFALTQEGFEGRQASPFGVTMQETIQFSLKQFQVRMDVLARAGHQTIAQINIRVFIATGPSAMGTRAELAFQFSSL
ncbi:hypothetical protein [Effusibacillus pohliae]|uniref:hypothetical protein n=1 Tax=Effusibacillus pohliae TaxID=232270 RepID=UPI00036D3F22|nr:hypothetical protein [Effusibacillus pohliae]